jgi:hypothetical protein
LLKLLSFRRSIDRMIRAGLYGALAEHVERHQPDMGDMILISATRCEKEGD